MLSRLKNVVGSLCFLALAAPNHSTPAVSQQAGAAIAVPQAEVLLVFIRSAMAALDHANKTGNYSVLRELGGPAIQANSSAQLSNLFANLRNSQADLLATLVVTPQLTQAPGISPQGLLQLAGVFPTRPQQIAFQIVYQPVNGQWRLYGLAVSLQPGDPATANPVPASPAPVTHQATPQAPPKTKGSATGLPPDKGPSADKPTDAKPK